MDLVCVVLSLPMPDDRRTLPNAAPTARAFRSLLTLRASTARNAAAVPYLTALSSGPDFPTSFVVPALLAWIPIVVVGCRHPQICLDSLLMTFAHAPTSVAAVLMRGTVHQRKSDHICPSAVLSIYFVAMTSATSCCFSGFSAMKAIHNDSLCVPMI